MAEERIGEHGSRRDWAAQMGPVLSPSAPQKEHKATQAAVAVSSDSPPPSDIQAASPTPTPAPAAKLPSSRPSYRLRSESTDNGVHHQDFYEGTYCIPSSRANRRIRDIHLLLTELNTVHGTTYSFENVSSLRPVLEDLLQKEYDFGMIYGLLRCWWPKLPGRLSSLLVDFQTLERDDTHARLGAVSADKVTWPRFPPRRVWDLYSNRVLPIWAIVTEPQLPPFHIRRHRPFKAVSHAWLPPYERQNVDTPINGHKWPVSIPADISLTDIRIELLNLGTEYVWLDVLCLRQVDGAPHEEAHRRVEWKIDVPTIGAVYEDHTVIVYLSGLGRPFVEGDLESQTHWCNRAWTLQEWSLADKLIVAGITAHSPMFRLTPRGALGSGPEDAFAQRLASKLATDKDCTLNIFDGVAAMRQRRATREVDRIAGLAIYFARGDVLPTFYQEETVDAAWLRFVRSMLLSQRTELFFFFPAAGESAAKFKWLPSWNQLLESERPLVWRELSTKLLHEPEYSPVVEPGEDFYTCRGVLVPFCHIAGFDSVAPVEQDSTYIARRRCGTISFEVEPNNRITLAAIAYHKHPIPDGSYAVFSNLGECHTCRYWVLGALDADEGQFSKITVLQLNRGLIDETQEEKALNAELYMALDLIKSDDGGDIHMVSQRYQDMASRWDINVASRWVRKVVLA